MNVAFSDIPLGARFRYPGGDTIWTVIDKVRESDGMHGTLAEWKPDMLTYGYWPGQRIVGHFPPDCPEIVEAID